MSTTEAPPRPDGRSEPGLATDGPGQPRTAPFRHEHSPRVRRLAKRLGVDLGAVGGTGPGGRVRPADVRGAAPGDSEQGTDARPRLAVDGPRRARVGPFRHSHSPRVRRLGRELQIDLDDVDGTGPSGRVRPVDVEEAASSTSPAPVAASTPSPTAAATAAPQDGSAKESAAGADAWLTVQFDLAPLHAAWRRIAAGPAPEGVPSTPFLLFTHALLGALPSAVEAVGGRVSPDDPLIARVELPDNAGLHTLRDGDHLTFLGLLRRLDQADQPADGATHVVIRDGSARGATSEVPPRTGNEVLTTSLGVIREQPVVSRDEFGHQVTTIRPLADLTLRYDPRRASADAIGELVDVLRHRLDEIHRTVTT